MKIRPYTGSDKPHIMALLRLNTPAYFSPDEEEDLLYYLDRHATDYYVLEVDGNILGCGGFNLADDRETVKISWDIFHPGSQGKGYGRALMLFRIQKIKEIPGIKTLSVRTSQLVYPFYEKFGLQTREIIKDYWADGFHLYDMDRALEEVAGQ